MWQSALIGARSAGHQSVGKFFQITACSEPGSPSHIDDPPLAIVRLRRPRSKLRAACGRPGSCEWKVHRQNRREAGAHLTVTIRTISCSTIKSFRDSYPIYGGLAMHVTAASPVSDRRPDACRHDASLERIVDEARQEFSEFSDQEIKALWRRFQSVLLGWAMDSGEVLPQHRTHFLSQGGSPNAFSLSDASLQEVDFVFLFFLAGQYPPLLEFLQDLAPQPLSSLRKAFALMILREAEEQNCPAIRRLMSSFERVLQ